MPYCNVTQQNTLALKNDHVYYFQVMGQLHITRRNVCYFVIHTKNWTSVENIYYDKRFWEEKMVTKLQMYESYLYNDLTSFVYMYIIIVFQVLHSMYVTGNC